MSLKNARTLGIRLDEKDAALLQRYEEETSMEGVGLARAALKAALKHYEQTGSLTIPLQVVPVDKFARAEPYSSDDRQMALLAEKPADYKAQSRKKATG